MTISKRKLLETTNITDQNALVSKLTPNGPRIIKNIIPSGKHIFTQVDKTEMERAVYNWLRGCGGFTEVMLSFAKEPEVWTTATSKAVDFDTRDARPIWTRTPDGRRNLAKDIASIINDNNRRLISITAKADGIYIGEDKKGAFQPRVVVTEENQDQFPGHTIGDRVAGPDWEPFIRFVASNRSRYTQYNRDTK